MSFSGFFSGIADEAARTIDKQLQAHQELGWKHIELRAIDGVNLTDVDDATFESIRTKLEAAEMQVSCFASQLANWARPISGDFEIDIAELRRAIPRMHALGTPFIRCMSYPNASPPLDEADWHAEVVRRLKVLADMAADANVTLVHENCDGWGGLGRHFHRTAHLFGDSPEERHRGPGAGLLDLRGIRPEARTARTGAELLR